MTIYVKNKYRLQVDDFTFKCCVGKNGVSKNKVEGDKKTPFGVYHIENLYYRKDRDKKPFTKLKCIKIVSYFLDKLLNIFKIIKNNKYNSKNSTT